MHRLLLQQRAASLLFLHFMLLPSAVALIGFSSLLKEAPTSSLTKSTGSCCLQISSTAVRRQPKALLESYCNDNSRRSSILFGLFGGIFSGPNSIGVAKAESGRSEASAGRPTNEVVKVVNGIKHRRLGGSDIVVSELGLGTQRWCSTDFNAPNEEDCFAFMDEAILKHGVSLIDTAEQYPIPSSPKRPEGTTEEIIGKWIKSRNVPRRNVVIATKITGGRNVTPKNLKKDCDGSLKRLGMDYIDVYQLHWPQRYSPQSNWGQSMQYHLDIDSDPYWRAYGGPTSFEDLCYAMQGLIQEGKIRSWGLCNDNAYGLTACTRTAKALGTTPPCSIQGDFSMVDRKASIVVTWMTISLSHILIYSCSSRSHIAI